MRHDWLLGTPRVRLRELEQWLAERLAADPAAAAISDAEAEEFFAVSYMVRGMPPEMRRKVALAVGARVFGGGEKAMRLSTIAILRKWKEPKARERLVWLIPNTTFTPWPIVADRPEAWTEELFAAAYEQYVNVVWLVRICRYLGKADDLSGWLNRLSDTAEAEYKAWLDAARLTLRRIVYPDAAPPQTTAAASSMATVAELREKERETGALRHDLRRLERDRRQLKKRARREEHEAKAMLSQARGEVAAARRALTAQRAAHEQELAALARRFEQEMRLERQRLAAARQEFVQAMTALADGGKGKVLAGRRITLTDCQGDEQTFRLMVESLGGACVPGGGEVALSAASGLAALERELRDLALQQVLIQCDGLYRRKEGRHGIAVAGMQVVVGGQVLRRETGVVSCGPWAGSLMAEYGALALALNWLISIGLPHGAQVVIWSDCRSLISRLRRTQGVKRKRGCITLDAGVRRAIRKLRQQGCALQIRWVPRDEVEAVDRLCDSAYRGLRWYHRRGSRPKAPLRAFLREGVPRIV